MWGLFPLYWPLLEPAGAVEILAHRICWSLVTMVVLTLALRRTPHLRAILRDRRVFVLLAVASVVIGFNWGGFIYGVNNDRVVEVSLGYFINPLVTVLLGVLVLGERLRPVQWAAIGIAGAGGARPDRRLRPPAVDRVAAGRLVRHLRAGQEEGRRRCGREPDLRDARCSRRSRWATSSGSRPPGARLRLPRRRARPAARPRPAWSPRSR